MIPNWVFTAIGALVLASVAGFFSITGLGALYAASFIPVVIMAVGIEFGKITATFWVHNNYRKVWTGWIVGAVCLILIAMGITSGGVFGFLSKGHLDQGTPIADNKLRIERINNSIDRDKRLIKGAQVRLDQLDRVVDTLIKYDKISNKGGARDVLARQKPERTDLNTSISEANKRIESLLNERLGLSQKVNTVEAKLGPVKFLAELFGADTNQTVRYFTLMIVLLLDPFAIYLVIMTGLGYDRWKEQREVKLPEPVTVEVEKIVEKIVEIPVETIVEKIIEKEVEVPVEKIVEKEVKVYIDRPTEENIEPKYSEETITEFLENEEIQDELVKNPNLIVEVEKMLQKVKDHDDVVNSGWIRSDGKPMEFSHKDDKSA